MGRFSIIIGIFLILSGLAAFPFLISYNDLMTSCQAEFGSSCKYSIPSFIAVFFSLLILGIYLIYRNRVLLIETLKEKITGQTREMSKEEFKRKKQVEADREVGEASLVVALSVIGILTFSGLLIGLIIAFFPLPNPQTNPGTYIVAGVLALIAILDGLCWWALFHYRTKRHEAQVELESYAAKDVRMKPITKDKRNFLVIALLFTIIMIVLLILCLYLL